MAKNCINYYYRCRHIYEAFRASYKAFWIKYTTPLIAYLDKYFSNATGFLSWQIFLFDDVINGKKKQCS